MTDSARPPVKVLFMAGAGRSGSTILHNILGQVDGFTAVGELRDIWQRGVLQNWLCGCGVPFDECSFWQTVLEGAFGQVSPEQAASWRDAVESFRTPHLPQAALPGRRRQLLEQTSELRDVLSRLYRAIAECDRTNVVVDSSKNPAFGFVAAHTPGVDVRFLHFIRDAPAVAYSWRQRKEFEPGRSMKRHSLTRSTLQWAARNGLTEVFLGSQRPMMRLTYEDFLREPRTAVAEIVRWMDEEPATLPFTGSHEAVLAAPIHSVFGNAVRFQSGPVTLRLDERWRRHLPGRERRCIELATWPLRHRYGYTSPEPGQREPRSTPA